MLFLLYPIFSCNLWIIGWCHFGPKPSKSLQGLPQKSAPPFSSLIQDRGKTAILTAWTCRQGIETQPICKRIRKPCLGICVLRPHKPANASRPVNARAQCAYWLQAHSKMNRRKIDEWRRTWTWICFRVCDSRLSSPSHLWFAGAIRYEIMKYTQFCETFFLMLTRRDDAMEGSLKSLGFPMVRTDLSLMRLWIIKG